MLCLVVIGSASEDWPRMQTTSAHTYQTISGRFSNRGGFFNSSFFGNKHLETYKMAADSLLRFRREYGFPDSWPVPLDQLINFVAYLSFTGLSPASVTTYISGIGYAHKARGLEVKTNNFLITKILCEEKE